MSGEDLNLRATFFHVLYDAVSSVAVVGAALAIRLTGIRAFDPPVSLGIALLILVWAVGIIGESMHILLEAAPQHIDLSELRTQMQGLPNVHHVHDVHVWQITTNMHILTAHAVVEDATLQGGSRVLERINTFLRERYGIGHCTLQLECGTAEEEHHGTTPRESEAGARADEP